MANCEYNDCDLFVLDATYDAVVVDPVSPETGERAHERFAKGLGVVGRSHAHLKILNDLALNRLIKAGEIALGASIEPNRPA